VDCPVVVEPPKEPTPRCIADALCQLPILDEVADLQVFVGNQIVRFDERACRLSGKVFTLPVYFQISISQRFPAPLALSALLFLAGKPSMQLLQPLLCFSQMTGVLNGVAFRVREKCFQAHIYPGVFASRNMFSASLSLQGKLSIVAIGPLDEAYPLDLLERKLCHFLLPIANQAQVSNTTAIGEGDVLAIGFQFPAGLFVLHRSIIMLKTGIALLT